MLVESEVNWSVLEFGVYVLHSTMLCLIRLFSISLYKYQTIFDDSECGIFWFH